MNYPLGYARVSRLGLWYEPPRWFPKWLHLRTCTFCRGMRAYLRKAARR